MNIYQRFVMEPGKITLMQADKCPAIFNRMHIELKAKKFLK
jgi:hypothetical protein